ncbi:hypothetical protein DAETH_36510 (plasmid) [Deinococcus aetherius]|uniref:SnoaL-like domain-containing protein n=1 Tax=Deinococcus aetherius TaxID=200252 RepID=A0ABN6RK16_9DEIO|nr:nuclear transport factor 2 family protein [Deinococcus aetherius]BDP43682.1 hypothetical protein DAETH_36510 [Deinococcus aetherius]
MTQDEQARQYTHDLLQAINDKDTPRFLNFFTETGAVEDDGRTFRGRDDIRRWSDDELIGAGGQVTVTAERVTSRGVEVDLDYTSSDYSGPTRFVLTWKGTELTSLKVEDVGQG